MTLVRYVALALAVLVVPAAAATDDAPADVYFGPQKLSPISLRHRIDSLGQSYAKRWASDEDLSHDATIVRDALERWSARYPRDRWLPQATFHLAQLFAEIQTQAARTTATSLFRETAGRYGGTPPGRLSRLRLAQGFPVLHAESPAVPTPNPYASAAASGAPATATASAASPVATTAASPAATVSTSPSPLAARRP